MYFVWPKIRVITRESGFLNSATSVSTLFEPASAGRNLVGPRTDERAVFIAQTTCYPRSIPSAGPQPGLSGRAGNQFLGLFT